MPRHQRIGYHAVYNVGFVAVLVSRVMEGQAICMRGCFQCERSSPFSRTGMGEMAAAPRRVGRVMGPMMLSACLRLHLLGEVMGVLNLSVVLEPDIHVALSMFEYDVIGIDPCRADALE